MGGGKRSFTPLYRGGQKGFTLGKRGGQEKFDGLYPSLFWVLVLTFLTRGGGGQNLPPPPL